MTVITFSIIRNQSPERPLFYVLHDTLFWFLFSHGIICVRLVSSIWNLSDGHIILHHQKLKSLRNPDFNVLHDTLLIPLLTRDHWCQTGSLSRTRDRIEVYVLHLSFDSSSHKGSLVSLFHLEIKWPDITFSIIRYWSPERDPYFSVLHDTLFWFLFSQGIIGVRLVSSIWNLSDGHNILHHQILNSLETPYFRFFMTFLWFLF